MSAGKPIHPQDLPPATATSPGAVTFGTAAATACEGNDSRLSDSRAPSGSAGGDLTGSYPNPTLATAGPGATGPIGDSSTVPVVTIDAKGRVTALTSAAIAGGPPSGAAGGDLTGTYPNPTLAAAGPGATGPLGGATVAPIVTIDAKGRVTALSSATITGTVPGGSAGGDLTGSYPNPTFNTSVVTPAAKTVLDDATVSAMVDTLGGAAATGSGALVRKTTPTLTTPILNKPNLRDVNGVSVLEMAAIGVVSPVNDWNISNSATGDAVTLSAQGTDANISCNVIPKGSGALQENGVVVVKTTDSRLSDSRAPNGSAGGDLTGSYPNPTVGANKIAVAQMHASATDVLFGRSTAAAGAGEEIACTAAGRALISGASASAQRNTLGLGTIATGDRTIARLTGDVTTTNATATDVTGLSFSIGASEVWAIEVHMLTKCSTVNGHKWALNVPASGLPYVSMRSSRGSVASILSDDILADDTLSATTGTGTYAAGGWVDMFGLIVNSTNSGTVQVRFASATAGDTTTVKNGSYLIAYRVA